MCVLSVLYWLHYLCQVGSSVLKRPFICLFSYPVSLNVGVLRLLCGKYDHCPFAPLRSVISILGL